MKAMLLVSLWLGAVLLVPSGAHVLEMAHKLDMSRDDYFVAQRLYLGWSLFGVPIVAKIVLDAAIAAMLRVGHPRAALAALASSILVAGGLAVFFLQVQPANRATANWLQPTPDWQALRQGWEHGHLAIAVLTALAFAAISLAVTRAPWRAQV